jgi:SAM-dependent methyltransferase
VSSDDPVRADSTGFWLPAPPAKVLDVHLAGHRAFSIAPEIVRVDHSGAFVPWPPRLQPYVDGHADLRVVEHLTGVTVLQGPIQVGTEDRRIEFLDSEGRPLAIDKFGNAVRTFDDLDQDGATAFARAVAALTRDVDAFGVCAFLAYGSLLGAVRDGHVIGHDTDADIAYLSNHTHPGDIALESFALERFLQARGWRTQRERVGLVHALVEDAAGDHRQIDIFVAIITDDHLFLDRVVEAQLDRSAFEPQSTVLLEGVEVLAPADPHALLEATYGPDYLTPDPAFRFDNPVSRERSSRALLGNYRFRRPHWVRYLSAESENRPPGPTDFARWARQQERRYGGGGRTWVDLGCGTSTDAIWAARQQYVGIGIDFAAPALRRLAGSARSAGVDARFWYVSFHDLRTVLAAGAAMATTPSPRVVTCRLVVDVLDREGRSNLWLLARAALLGGGRMYLQFRTRGTPADRDEPTFRAVAAERILEEARQHGATARDRLDQGRTSRLVLTWG